MNPRPHLFISLLRATVFSGLSLQTAVAELAPPTEPIAPSSKPTQVGMYIQEYRVEGSKTLSSQEVGDAVYPFLGPERTEADIEKARAALEKAYREKGYQTVTVEIPQQKVKRGIVMLRVVENRVGRLRVKGSRYFDLEDIKRKVPSLAEGKVPNFNDVTREMLTLNTLPDRHVLAVPKPGAEPGTVDFDLNVKDTPPLHGSVELNNRASPDTTDLRLNASLSYNNLWQLGHSVGASFQVSPQDPNEVKVLSGFYIARFPRVDWLSLMATATKQDSNVSTLGGAAVAGKGEIAGLRAMVTLPPRKDFFHSLSFGADYKNFRQTINAATGLLDDTPVTYVPLNLTYNAAWNAKYYSTQLSADLVFNVRGTEESRAEFQNSRFRSDSNFIYLRGELDHTQKLPRGFEAFAKVAGQLADQPLISNEQFTGGGLGSVRGYLEAEAVGDSGVFGTLELRTPSLLSWFADKAGELRLYTFVEGGILKMHDVLPDQDSNFELASVGVGGRLRLVDHVGGSVDIGLPLVSQSHTQAYDPHLTFRVWTDF